MNYSGRFAAADSKAENSLCVFLHDAIWESTNLLWRATVYAASRSKLISTTSVTASCLIFMVEENVWERRERGDKNGKEGSGKKKKIKKKNISFIWCSDIEERDSVNSDLKRKREGPKTQILWEGIVEYADKLLIPGYLKHCFKLLEVTDIQIWWSPLGYEVYKAMYKDPFIQVKKERNYG